MFVVPIWRVGRRRLNGGFTARYIRPSLLNAPRQLFAGRIYRGPLGRRKHCANSTDRVSALHQKAPTNFP